VAKKLVGSFWREGDKTKMEVVGAIVGFRRMAKGGWVDIREGAGSEPKIRETSERVG